jgi:transcriptional regulator with XRE-family HTH domain
MTGPGFLAAIEALGLTREAFASRFGLHFSTVYRWTAGARAVPPWVPEVIQMLAAEDQHWLSAHLRAVDESIAAMDRER